MLRTAERGQWLTTLQTALTALQAIKEDCQQRYEKAKRASFIADDAGHLKTEAELKSINQRIADLEQEIAKYSYLVTQS